MNETTKQTRPQNRYDVSCLVTFHSEGYLAHRTLTSIGMCRDYAEKRGLHVELVLVLDNADAVTEAVVAGHFAVRKDDQILRVHERSAPMSRNKGIQAAKGEFISIHDGDDYYSENLVYEGVAQCKAQPRLITHAEINIGFESEYYMYRVGNIRHGDYTKYDLLTQNPLSVQTIAPRHVFIQIPYQPTGNGFGYEDWHWNAETIAAGFEHVTVPHTFMFYRRKRQGSVLARESASKSLIRPSRLFDQLESPMHELSSSILRDNLSENTSRKPVVSADLADVVKTARRKSRLYAFLKPPAKKLISKLPDDLQPPAKAFAWSFLALARSVREHVRNKRPTPAVQTSPAVPQTEKPAPEIFPTVSMAECVAALKRISRLDSSLHPDVNPPLYEYRFVSDDRLGRLFALLYNPIKGQRYDAVYLVPWLVPGGADLMTINFANTLAGQGKKVLVISTLPCPSPWRNQLAEGVDFVDLGNAADGFFNEDKKLLLARILLLEIVKKCPRLISSFMVNRMRKRTDTCTVLSNLCRTSLLAENIVVLSLCRSKSASAFSTPARMTACPMFSSKLLQPACPQLRPTSVASAILSTIKPVGSWDRMHRPMIMREQWKRCAARRNCAGQKSLRRRICCMYATMKRLLKTVY
ncbi:glycosyltransferase [Pyramidobacter sp. YE332]|uniref:glycosyltransferase n=1 Tax=Pyramidobacter sp. YE332 TaxID=3068894 RepID=UPI00294AFD80|nr:glycosyltransferase [Pyramidobacter sp. YE332]WOL40615.1 glycosyltransferase [Pyramidobacter sp. YE332]